MSQTPKKTNRFRRRAHAGGNPSRRGGGGSRFSNNSKRRPMRRNSSKRVYGRGKRKAAQDISSFISRSSTLTGPPEEQFTPTHSFNDFAIGDGIKRALDKRGYKVPTPIQDEIIPHILQGKDVVGLANTGTGKTAAFLVPLIEKILQNKGESMLVLAPTRELAIQIEDEFTKLTNQLGLHSVVLVGGAHIGKQMKKLRMKNHLYIGTPGRIMDLINRGNLKLGGTRTIVLDEADRMLDMGFIRDIRYIMGFVPDERHTLCFGATMAPEIDRLIQDFLVDPITVSVKKQDSAKNVKQSLVKVSGRDKTDVLFNLLTQEEFEKTIVFGRTKYGVEKLSKKINKRGLKVESIHGNKSHSQRQRALTMFRNGSVSALIATDVAARGLDISGVTHVINFDVPETYDDYVHRIGRTGRGTNMGKALTFVDK